MKFKIERKNILTLLGKTQNIVDKKNTMPILVNVLLDVSPDGVRVFATDLEVSLTDFQPAQVESPGKVAVGAKALFDIIKELDDEEIEFEKNDNNWLLIKQKRYRSKIVGVSPDEYPVFPNFTVENFSNLPSQTLRDMIEKTIYSVSNDETRYHLNGVFFQMIEADSQPSYRMVATDGHRLCVVDRAHKAEQQSHNIAGVIIPRKGLNEIKKLIESSEETIEFAVEGSQLILRQSETVLMIRLIEGKYPNYQQLIPQSLGKTINLKKEEFLNSLKRVSLLSHQKSRGVTFSLNNGKMEIASNNPELGDAKEELEIGYDGEELRIGFNAKYIIDILNNIDSEAIQLELNDQLSPGVIRGADDQSYTCVVMPMRI